MTKHSQSKLLRFTVVLAIMIAAFAAAITSASAAVRLFALDVGTHSAGAGTTATYHATITNESGGILDSVTLIPPAGFTVLSPPGGTFSGLGLSVSGPPAKVTFTARTACAASGSSFNWSASGKTPDGQPYTLDTGPNSKLVTTVTGNCSLAFTGQPANSQTNVAISTVPYTPPSDPSNPPPVSVQLLDANNAVTSQADGASVTLTMSPNPGSLSGGSAILSSGAASFPSLTVGQSGLNYALTAAVPSNPAIVTSKSQAFQVWDKRQKCNANTSCTDTYTPQSGDLTTQATATFPSDGGILVSYNVQTSPCAHDSWNHLPDVVTLQSQDDQRPNGPWLITLNVAKYIDQQQPNNGASFYQICLATKVQFTTLDGTPATPCNGTDCPVGFYYGLMQNAPKCTDPQPNACILSKTKTRSGVVVLVLQLPPNDPWGH